MSNYINSLSINFDRYDRISMDKRPSIDSSTDHFSVDYSSHTQSNYINSDAIKYVSKIQENAKSLATSLRDMGNMAAIKMASASPGNETTLPVEDTAGSASDGMTQMTAVQGDSNTVGKQQLEADTDTKNAQKDAAVPQRQDASDTSHLSHANQAAGKMTDITERYNSLLDASRSGKSGNARLQNELTGVVKGYRPALEKLGVTMEKDGKLSVDQEKLSAAAENGSLESFLTRSASSSFSFSGRLENITDNVARNAPRYLAQNQAETDESEYSDMLSFADSFSLSGNHNLSNSAMIGMLFNVLV